MATKRSKTQDAVVDVVPEAAETTIPVIAATPVDPLATSAPIPRAIASYVKDAIAADVDGRDPPAPPPGIAVHERRVPDLTADLIARIQEKMLHGAPAERCAQSLGVIPRVFRRWMDLGRAGVTEIHVALLQVVEQTEAEFEVTAMSTIAAGRAQWQSRAWQLERLYPDRYALRTKQEVTGANGGAIVIGLGRAQLPPETAE